jgi:hypothetical protein
MAIGSGMDLFAQTTANIDDGASPWSFFNAGPFHADDGILVRSDDILVVRSVGRNAASGLPMFTKTVAQEDPADENPLPGGLDHAKWLVYSKRSASSGVPGFDVPMTGELVFKCELGVCLFGLENQPFGSAVPDINDDLRIGCAAMSIIDFETLMIFDFMLTNKGIYAFYERLPFARQALGNYASFSFAKRVGERTQEQMARLEISYSKELGRVVWRVDDVEVMRVDRIGELIEREHMVLDHGGVGQSVSPNQLACGFGLLTLLDASDGNGSALVRLSTAPGFYANPRNGSEASPTFASERSDVGDRLFGQGGELRLAAYSVSERS